MKPKKKPEKKILKDVLTIAEVAEFLGIGKQWIYVLLDEGRLIEVSTKGGKVRLVDARSVQGYAEEREAAKEAREELKEVSEGT